jgi:hypothetical protein
MMKDFDSYNYLEIKGIEVACKYVHVGRLVNQKEVGWGRTISSTKRIFCQPRRHDDNIWMF